MEVVCRVCLANDRSTYRVANKALEHTYDVITGVKLQQADWPTALCCVCASQLRRCRKFVETARESNAALDCWYRRNTDFKLTAQPLITFTKITTKLVDILESSVKQDYLETDEKKAIVKEEIKYYEVAEDEVQNHSPHEDCDNIQMSDDEQHKTKMPDDNINVEIKKENANRKDCDGVEGNILNVEWVDAKDDEMQLSYDVKFEILETSDVVAGVPGSVAADTSNVDGDCSLSDQDIASSTFGSRKRINVDQDTDDPAVKQGKSTTARHRPGSTDTASAPRGVEAVSDNKRDLKNSSEKPFTCDKCEYRSNFNANLKRHLMTHTDQKLFSCDNCDYRSKDKRNLQYHLMAHAGSKPFACDRCDYKCVRKTYLKTHIMTHTGEKPFACDKCDFRCNVKSSLNQHLVVHNSAKPFACNRCDFRCNVKGSLRQHLLIHSGEKPFACVKCSYRSNRKAYLKRHSLIHTGEKQFACDNCDFRCTMKGDLKRHSLTHADKKLFACDNCDYKCNIKRDLRTHLMNHTGEKLFSCNKCDFRCNRKDNLKAHLLTHAAKKL